LGKIFMQLGEAMADRWAARRAVWPQYLLPKQALTAFAGWVATRRWGHATTRLIAWFVNKYQVDMAQAAQPDIAAYAHFNDFFTRALRSDARPLAAARWLCPVDGAISQFGAIENGQIFQAKGHAYSATALVGGDSALAAQFAKGSFATLYLSPRDYHRIHMPCAATLRQMVYVPGDLFSVNPTTARGVPGLFARNERVVCVFDTTQGPMVLVLVGATIVGSMATVWHGVVNPPRTGRISRHDYPGGQVHLAQGEEMGRFLLGSTVVLLLPEAAPGWNPGWQPGGPVCMGQAMAGAS
jgi:phosphatidylserine decarboxylase